MKGGVHLEWSRNHMEATAALTVYARNSRTTTDQNDTEICLVVFFRAHLDPQEALMK